MAHHARHLLAGTLGLLPFGAGFAAEMEKPPVTAVDLVSIGETSAAAQLIDRTIPSVTSGYDMVYRPQSRVADVYLRIRTFASDVERRVMAGQLAKPPQTYVQPEGEDGQVLEDANPVPAEREPLPEEERLAELLGDLAVLREEVTHPNHFEEWQLDNSWRDLQAASDTLHLGIGADRYVHLEELHAAWVDFYHTKLKQAQAQLALDLLKENPDEYSSAAAVAEAKQQVVKIPYPKMRLEVEAYPPVEIPEVLTDAELKERIARMKREKEAEERAAAKAAKEAEEAAQREAEAQAKVEAEAAAAAKAEAAAAKADMAPPAAAIAMPELDSPDARLAGALVERGEALYMQGVEAGNTDARDDLLNHAELVLQEAVDMLDRLITDGDAALEPLLVRANKAKYGSVKSSRTDAQQNADARRAAKQTIEEVLAAAASSEAEPPAVVEEPPVAEEPPAVVEEPPVEEAPPAVVEEPPVEEAPPAVVEEPPVEEAPPAVVEEPPVAEVEPPAEPIEAEEAVEPPAEEPPAEEEEEEADPPANVLEDFEWPE